MDHRIVGSGTIKVRTVNNRIIYTPARRVIYSLIPVLNADVMSLATGSNVSFYWTHPEPGPFEIQVCRLSYDSLQPSVVFEASTDTSSYTWMVTRAGLYSFRFRRAGTDDWIDSKDSAAPGARGWIVFAYLAPVSRGGIR